MQAIDRHEQDSLQRRSSLVGLALSLTLLCTACGGGGDKPVTETPPKEVVPNSENSDDPTITKPTPVNTFGERDQYPLDTDGDDLPSLIVTGMDGADPSQVRSEWLASLRFFRLASKTPGTGDGRVAFLRYDGGNSVSRHIDFFKKDLEECSVRDPRESRPGGSNNSPPLISAGPTAVINSPAGTWFTFNRELDDDGEWEYETDNGLPSAIPDGATLSVIGHEFPTVSAYPIYEPEPPIRLLPEDNVPLGRDSGYAWIPGKNKTYMLIDFKAYDDDGNFRGFAGYCYVEDDGSFEMPEKVKEFIESIDLTIYARYAREYNRVDLVNGIVFRQKVAVAE